MKDKQNIIFFYLVIVALLLLLPINGKESKINHTYVLNLRLDYWIHILLFSPWMIFKLLNKIVVHPFWWFIIGIFIAMASEGIQYAIPYRAYNINDLIANVSGVILGVPFMLFNKNRSSVL